MSWTLSVPPTYHESRDPGTGFRCVVGTTALGIRTAYVAVPASHITARHASRVEAELDIHGGISWSRDRFPWEGDTFAAWRRTFGPLCGKAIHVFGLDCCHFGDAVPALDLPGEERTARFLGDAIRDLADQLRSWQPKNPHEEK